MTEYVIISAVWSLFVGCVKTSFAYLPLAYVLLSFFSHLFHCYLSCDLLIIATAYYCEIWQDSGVSVWLIILSWAQ